MEFFKDFFQRLFQLQPRFMATFGSDTEELFDQLHDSVKLIQAASRFKATDTTKDEDAEHQKVYEKVRETLKGVIRITADEDEDDETQELDLVAKNLKEFREESRCKRIVDREYRGFLF
jgi:hypothetical protein